MPEPTSEPRPRPKRQEQEPATAEVTEVAPGVLRTQLPIALPGLGHVNTYLIEDERGVAVVDPGLPGPASWRALQDRLKRAGVPLRRVHTVIVTHSHPDHFGGAGRLRQAAGAEVVAHRSFRTWWDPAEDEALEAGDDAPPVDRRPPWARPTPWGSPYSLPLKRRVAFRAARTAGRVMGRTPAPTWRVEDAEVLRLGRREWVAVHTPGHTADHLCLLDPAGGVLLSGDHVLPSITPHISGLGDQPDTLASFFASLDRVAAFEGVTTVLPAHGHPFQDLAGRAKAIRSHHEQRLDGFRDAARELGRASVADLTRKVFPPRSWSAMAESETYAHLEHLRIEGVLRRSGQGDDLLYEAV